ncbi:MAG TPA: DnaA/Hda family protein, partial [Luteolibacter sp.]|nr:DnaA/Hda family protein [Luteolibacter sp.]
MESVAEESQVLIAAQQEIEEEINGWEEVCSHLRECIGNDAFQRWFRVADWAGQQEGVALVAVPGEIHQVWIETNFLPELTMAISSVFEEVREVRVIVSGEAHAEAHTPQRGSRSESAAKSVVKPQIKQEIDGEALDRRIRLSGLNASHTFSSFVVGSNNQFAHAACMAVATKSGPGYNPLFIHGGPGMGKTHL